MSFLTECVVPEDCPNGGINFKCIANECECPKPFVLDGNKCLGMVKILFVILRGHPKMTQKKFGQSKLHRILQFGLWPIDYSLKPKF